MARDANLKATITAKDDASKVIDKLVDKAEDLEKPVEMEVDADVAKVLGAFDQIATEAKATAAAADALGSALGPELASQADPTRIVGELKNMGLTLDQITTNADQLGAKMRELADADVGGNLGSSLGTARGQIDDLGKSADSSKSVLANMIGNSVQDVGALGGVAGSAGVAIGQMGEYMADAAAGGDSLKQVLSGFGSVAGPLAALAAATQMLNEVMAARARASDQETASLEAMSDALAEGGDAASAYAAELADAGEVQGRFGKQTADDVGGLTSFVAKMPGAAGIAVNLAGKFGLLGEKTDDLVDDFAAAGISAEQWAEAVTSGAPGADKMADALAKTSLSADDQAKILDALGNAQEDWSTSTANATEVSKVFGDTTDDTAAKQEKATGRTNAQKEATQDLVDEFDAANEAAQGYADTISGADWAAVGGIDDAVDSMSAFHDQFFALADIASANEAAFDAFGESLKDNGNTFDLNTEKGRANQGALQDLAGTLDAQLASALESSGGDLETFKGKAKDVADTLQRRLTGELGLSEEAAADLIDRLGLMPEDMETRYQLSGTEDARQKIGLLQSSIDALPKDVQTKVTQQIIAGDYQGALATIQDYYNRHPVRAAANVFQGTGWEIFNPKNISASVNVSKGTGWGIFTNPFGTTKAAPAPVPDAMQTAAPVPVAVDLMLPSAAQIARRIGQVKLPFAVASSLRADQRLAGGRDL
jgi:hypothetical protein